MIDLIILVGSVLFGGIAVFTVVRMSRRPREEEPLIRLEQRADILDDKYKRRPNTAREVGDALFGPEDRRLKRRRRA